jgi:hypothetical protein
MSIKCLLLASICALTVTACAHPIDHAIQSRADFHEKSFESSARIAGGACDDVGQFIPGSGGATTFTASADPGH